MLVVDNLIACSMLTPFIWFRMLWISPIGVCFIILIACSSVLGRYLILLDKFLADLSPQEMEAMVMPTLEEVRDAMDARGAQWVRQALAGNSSEYRQTWSNSCCLGEVCVVFS